MANPARGVEYGSGNNIFVPYAIAVPGVDADGDCALFDQPANTTVVTAEDYDRTGGVTTIIPVDEDWSYFERIMFAYLIGSISKRFMRGWGEESSQRFGVKLGGSFSAVFDYDAGFVVTNWSSQ